MKVFSKFDVCVLLKEIILDELRFKKLFFFKGLKYIICCVWKDFENILVVNGLVKWGLLYVDL